MKLILSRRRNRLYMVTMYAPELVELEGFPGIIDYQPRGRDPVFYNNMCSLITPTLAEKDFNIKMSPLDPPIVVDVVFHRPKPE